MEPGTEGTPVGGSAKGKASDGADAISRVIESAARLGVELDEHEANEWVAAMATESSGGDLVVDVNSGVYGHRVSMLDFQPADLAAPDNAAVSRK